MRLMAVVVACGALCLPAQVFALPCAVDDDLSTAASQLLALGRAPTGTEVEAAVRHAGSDAVNVRARWSADGDGPGVVAWVTRLSAGADAPLTCGQSAGSGGRLVLVSARAGRLRMTGRAGRVIQGELADGFDHPQLVLTQAHGELSAFAVDRRELREGFEIPDELERVTRVQLVARGPSGPRPVAERVWGSSATTAIAETDTQLSEDLTAEQQLDALREIHRAPAVRRNRLLTDVANSHVRAVCRQSRVAHTLGADGDPEQRLRAAGITARVVGETVARSTSVAKAYTALMRSPSHRLTLLDRRFTEVGVATAVEEGRTCLVVLLAAWPRYVGRSASASASR